MTEQTTAKDKQELVLNPTTGKLDTINKFNEDRILTHSRSSTGSKLKLFDPETNSYVDMGDLIITDENGNVVVV